MPAAIRQCTVSDLPAATAFLAELYRDRPRDLHLDGLPTRLSEFSLVAEHDGQVVGLVVAEKRSTDNLQDNTLDLELRFDTGHILQVIPDSSGYEAWIAHDRDKQFIAVGGGELAIFGGQATGG